MIPANYSSDTKIVVYSDMKFVVKLKLVWLYI